MQFVTGKKVLVTSKQSPNMGAVDQSRKKKKRLKKEEVIITNDLQEKICPNISKDYLDQSSGFFKDQMECLDKIIRLLNEAYFKSQSGQN